MILYCDSSALVKLYVEEPESAEMAAQAAAAEVLATCRITWVEVISALARRGREQPRDAAALELARQHLATDWPRFLVIELTDDVALAAANFTDVFALRAYDGVQLAAAHLLHRELPGEVRFACFDTRLTRAALTLGIAAP